MSAPERAAGDRDDAERRFPLSTLIRAPRPSGSGSITRPSSWLLRLAGAAVAALALVPLGFVLVYTVTIGPGEARELLLRPRVGELLFNTVRLVVAGMALSVGLGLGVCMAGGAHAGAVRPCLARAAGGPARRAGVRQQLRLDIADTPGRGLRRCGADRDAVVLPARLPPGGGVAARSRSCAGGGRLLPEQQPVAHLLAHRRTPAAPGSARWLAAGGSPPARRVRGPADAALPDVHDRDLRPVPVVVQRSGGHDARERSGRVLPRPAAHRAAAARIRALCTHRWWRRPLDSAPRSRVAQCAGPARARGRGRAGARRPAQQPGPLARGRFLHGVPDG